MYPEHVFLFGHLMISKSWSNIVNLYSLMNGATYVIEISNDCSCRAHWLNTRWSPRLKHWIMFLCLIWTVVFMISLQVHPHPDGLLVLPGRCHHFLLLHRTGDPFPKHLLHRQAEEQSQSHIDTFCWGACGVFHVCWRRLIINERLVFLQQRQEQELFPLGHSCAVCGKVKCKRHRYVHRIPEQITRFTWVLESLWIQGEKNHGTCLNLCI